MKLRINYDLIEALKNVNEPFGPFKIVRNHKREWVRFNLPIYTFYDYVILKNIPNTLICLMLQLGLLTSIEHLSGFLAKVDIYKLNSEDYLKLLVNRLSILDIETDYNLLLQSKLYDKNYRLNINKDKLPEIMESKYILLPSYKYNGEVEDTSLLQEHIIGSKDYYLSVKKKVKELKLVYV